MKLEAFQKRLWNVIDSHSFSEMKMDEFEGMGEAPVVPDAGGVVAGDGGGAGAPAAAGDGGGDGGGAGAAPARDGAGDAGGDGGVAAGGAGGDGRANVINAEEMARRQRKRIKVSKKRIRQMGIDALEIWDNPKFQSTDFPQKIRNIATILMDPSQEIIGNNQLLSLLRDVRINNIFAKLGDALGDCNSQETIINDGNTKEWNNANFVGWIQLINGGNGEDSIPCDDFLETMARLSFALYAYVGFHPGNGEGNTISVDLTEESIENKLDENNTVISDYLKTKIRCFYSHVGIAMHLKIPKMLLAIPSYRAEKQRKANLLFLDRSLARRNIEVLWNADELSNLKFEESN